MDRLTHPASGSERRDYRLTPEVAFPFLDLLAPVGTSGQWSLAV